MLRVFSPFDDSEVTLSSCCSFNESQIKLFELAHNIVRTQDNNALAALNQLMPLRENETVVKRIYILSKMYEQLSSDRGKIFRFKSQDQMFDILEDLNGLASFESSLSK